MCMVGAASSCAFRSFSQCALSGVRTAQPLSPSEERREGVVCRGTLRMPLLHSLSLPLRTYLDAICRISLGGMSYQLDSGSLE